MPQLESDLQLVKQSICAMDSIKPRRRMVNHPNGEVEDQDWGTLQWESDCLERLRRMSLTGPRCQPVGGGLQWTPAELQAIEEGREKRAEVNTWVTLLQNREKLTELLMVHVEGSVFPHPHAGFFAPAAGPDWLANDLSESTAIDWLLNCPERCKQCRMACRRDLERLRQALEAVQAANKRTQRTIHWKRCQEGNRTWVEVTNGMETVVLRSERARMFLEIASASPRTFEWKSHIDNELERARAILADRFSSGCQATATPRMAIKEESAKRKARRLKKDLGVMGYYLEIGPTGVLWNPPPGSGPLD